VQSNSDDSVTSNAVQTSQARWSAAVICGSPSLLYWMFSALGHICICRIFCVWIHRENVSWNNFKHLLKSYKPFINQSTQKEGDATRRS